MANGFFIGVATRFIQNFDRNADATVTKLFDDMSLPSCDELRKMLNSTSGGLFIDSMSLYNCHKCCLALVSFD